MAIGSHGTGRGGTVGAGRHGRRPSVGKALSLMLSLLFSRRDEPCRRISQESEKHWKSGRSQQHIG